MEEMERFGLTEEEKMLQNMCRRLAREKVAPGAEKRDQKGDYPYDMLELMKENGLMGVDFPAQYDGMAAGMLAHCIVVEELSKADASVGLIPSCQELGSLPIILAGTHEQKDKYLRPLAIGEKIGAFGLTEAKGGSDVADLKTRAVRKGDTYILNGSKMWITNGGVAHTYCIYAITDPGGPQHRNASVFIVERDWPGFEVGKKESKLGIRSSDTRELVFSEVEVPVGNRLGEEGQGFHIMMKTLDFSRPSVAAQAVGIAADYQASGHSIQTRGHGHEDNRCSNAPVEDLRIAGHGFEGSLESTVGGNPSLLHVQGLLLRCGNVGHGRGCSGPRRLWIQQRVPRGKDDA
jgi:alkylation response protein AidB-like acyl-CoA dehydrogenase